MTNDTEVIRDVHGDRRLTLVSGNSIVATSHRTAFMREWNPVGRVELALVEELARRADQMREFDDARAVLRAEAERTLANLLGVPGDGSQAKFDVARAGASAADRCEALLRQGLVVTAAFYRALEMLQKLQEGRAGDAWQELRRPDARFATEQSCLAYLVRRYSDRSVACRRCGQSGRGCFLAIRASWECGHCQSQTGIRVGTCMERSALPLTVWFAAIRAVLLRPAITPPDLAEMLSIRRVQTVAGVLNKVRRAIVSENATAQLAGLDEVYLGFT